MTPKIQKNTGFDAEAAELPEWLTGFRPRRGLRNGHLQTIVGNYLPRPAFVLESEEEAVEVDAADGSRVVCHCHWHDEDRAGRLTAILVHGLEGSSKSQYIRGIAARAWDAGMNVIRMNMRNCGDTDALHEPANRGYEWHFLRGLMRRFRRKVALFPELYDTTGIGPIKSLRQFDNEIVARYCDFADADDYYYRAAAARVVDRIVVPTLVLQANDDPFIRLFKETRAKLRANPHIAFVETNHGGHCAYLSQDGGDEIHWAEAAVIRFLADLAGKPHGS